MLFNFEEIQNLDIRDFEKENITKRNSRSLLCKKNIHFFVSNLILLKLSMNDKNEKVN